MWFRSEPCRWKQLNNLPESNPNGDATRKRKCFSEIVAHAVSEAKAYEEGGLDGIIVENAWDLPFLRPEDIWYETVATLSVVTKCVREASSLPIGVNLLANAGEAAIAVAKAAGGSFVRVNQFVNAYIANEGFVQGNSASILRYRCTLHAQEIAVLCG